MYAVVQTGGKQYTVSPGDLIKVEKIEGKPGDTIVLNEVLFVSDGKETKIGNPFVENASVNAELVETVKDKKVIVFKFKRRKNYRRKKGHRQIVSLLKIKEINS
ncbi:MAG: 50S ribosomal protein L21 [Candidatus Schekmanbacteria bacterium]|nr:MAG: 50S ribosomal protein L21 [Candidatus Schekmanbacteria bacterium]